MRAIMLAFACKQQYHALRVATAAGYSVHVLGRDCAEGLKYSRFCASYHPFSFDPLLQSQDEALAEITRWTKELAADLILPSDIVSTRLLAGLAGRLPVPTCALPDPAVFDMLDDKWQFYQFCKSQGVRVPETRLFDDMDELRAAIREGTVPFPFIVKPLGTMGGSGMCKIREAADLGLLDAVEYKPFLVQKLVTGEDIGINILANRGRVGAYAIQRNLPGKYEFIRHDSLLAGTTRVIEASGFHGVANFDAILEKATGDVYLLECNPRVWMSIFASMVAGMNFIKMNLDPHFFDPGCFDSSNPIYLADKEVDNCKSTKTLLIKLVKNLIKGRGVNKPDYNLLKYNFADPVGKKFSSMNKFDDAALPSGSSGSIDYQMAAVAALAKL